MFVLHRIFRMVTMKLIDPNNDENPAICNEKMA